MQNVCWRNQSFEFLPFTQTNVLIHWQLATLLPLLNIQLVTMGQLRRIWYSLEPQKYGCGFPLHFQEAAAWVDSCNEPKTIFSLNLFPNPATWLAIRCRLLLITSMTKSASGLVTAESSKQKHTVLMAWSWIVCKVKNTMKVIFKPPVWLYYYCLSIFDDNKI